MSAAVDVLVTQARELACEASDFRNPPNACQMEGLVLALCAIAVAITEERP